MSYLSIRNWEKYQHEHTGRRVLPWVKFYVRTLNDEDWRELTPTTRLLFLLLLLVAQEDLNVIRNDPERIASRVGLSKKEVVSGTRELLKGGWIKETQSRRRSRQESRPESRPRSRSREETPKPPLQLSRPPGFKCPRCGVIFKAQQRLVEHLDIVHDERSAA